MMGIKSQKSKVKSGEFVGKKVLVVGLGRSGIAVAKKLKELGADVICSDSDVAPIFEKEIENLEQSGIGIELGGHSLDSLKGRELIVVSPGVPSDIPLLIEARKRNITLWSEIELAYHFTSLPIIAVTGTNGKTTTVSIIGGILKKANRGVQVAGNIGFPLVEAVDKADLKDILVSEVSSFQLENIVSFAPHVGVLLNISEDHFDRHKTLQCYQEAKSRLFLNQTVKDFAIINFDDENSWVLAERVKSRVIPFSTRKESKEGVFVSSGEIKTGDGETVCRADDLKIIGRHNLENALAATAAALTVGVAPKTIGRALQEFSGLEHRLEHVLSIDGIDFYNDSKATNPDAAIKAIESFSRPIVLLAGGRNKGMDMTALKEPVKKQVKGVVLFGESAGEIEKVISGVIEQASSLEEAVHKAYHLAESGDVVLLSPACASFDMFSNYEERGKAFKEAVKRLTTED